MFYMLYKGGKYSWTIFQGRKKVNNKSRLCVSDDSFLEYKLEFEAPLSKAT